MKKPLFTIAALAASMTVASAPMTAMAAQAQPVMSDSGYVVYAGQGLESLQETLEQIWTEMENNGIGCPTLPEIVIPGQPGTQEPGTETPELPDQQEPDAEMPELPDNQAPDAETPAQPGTQEPDTGATDQPGVQEPGVETPDEDTVHPYVTRILELVNEERAKAGLSALELDTDITAAANVRAVEIKQSFSHTRPNGTSFSTALKEQGVSYRGSGENIAWGQKSPEQVMDGWMNSEGHRANILNANFKNIGIGYYQDQKGVNYWVQLFTY